MANYSWNLKKDGPKGILLKLSIKKFLIKKINREILFALTLT